MNYSERLSTHNHQKALEAIKRDQLRQRCIADAACSNSLEGNVFETSLFNMQLQRKGTIEDGRAVVPCERNNGNCGVIIQYVNGESSPLITPNNCVRTANDDSIG